MKFRSAEYPEDAHFDITAMIDIVLLLIIFFSFTAQFSRTLATPLDLPREKGAAGSSEGARQVLTIDLTRTGEVRVMGREVDAGWLSQTLARDVRSAGGAEHIEVIVRADRRCPASHLNSLAATLSASGVRAWKLATAGEGP